MKILQRISYAARVTLGLAALLTALLACIIAGIIFAFLPLVIGIMYFGPVQQTGIFYILGFYALELMIVTLLHDKIIYTIDVMFMSIGGIFPVPDKT